MKLRLIALGLGVVTGFVVGWARMTDPNTFRRMLSLDSPRIYLLMAAAVPAPFLGAPLLRGRRTPLPAEPVTWRTSAPTRNHVVGSVFFGIGWGITDACPGPTAAQLGGGRVFALAVAAGIVAGVRLQPWLARLPARLRREGAVGTTAIPAGDVL